MVIKDIIHRYQARCEQAVHQSEPGSAESMAYTALLEVFKQHQSNPNVLLLINALRVAAMHRALPLAERELHRKGCEAEQIAQRFVDEFQQAAIPSDKSFQFIVQ